MDNNLETILKEKVKEFSDYLISISETEDIKNTIRKKMSNLKITEILFFIALLNKEAVYKELDNFQDIKPEIKENIDKYIDYFLQVKVEINLSEFLKF